MAADARTTVTGQVRAVRPVRSPIQDVECCAAVTHVAGRDRWGIRRVVVVVTAHDFLLHAASGPYAVRVDGLHWHFEWGLLQIADPVRIALPGAVERALAASPLANTRVLRWNEQLLFDDDLVEITGACREETAPTGLMTAGLPGAALPTLRAGDGVLQLVFLGDPIYLGDPRFQSPVASLDAPFERTFPPVS